MACKDAKKEEEKKPEAPKLKPSTAYPMHRCKVIHLVRHGQASHNKAAEKNKEAYMSEEFFDAPLTTLGWGQAQKLSEHIKLTGAIKPQLVITSPLSRCIQTAIGVFGGGIPQQPGESAFNALMAEGVATERPAISSCGAPGPFMAVEWCREHIGVHPCDRRRNISELHDQYPAIDFSEIVSDEDVLWKPERRENDDEIQFRAKVFANWLMNLTEVRIAVVAHSGFLWELTRLFGEDCSNMVKKELQEGFANCEMRSIVMADKLGIGQPFGRTDFSGCSKRWSPGQ